MEKETNRIQEDRLKSLFKQMPAVSLSEGFRSQMMQRIEREAVRKRKRQAWLEWTMLIVASLIMIVTAVLGLQQLEIQPIQWPQIDTSLLFFYMNIGSAALFLLWLDYRFRRWYDKKHRAKEK